MNNFIEKTFLSSFDTVAKINIKSETLTYLKNSITKISPDIELSTEIFLEDFWKREKIHPDDEYLFELHLSSVSLKGMIEAGYSGLLFAYRSLYGDSYCWNNINIFIPDEADVTDILLCRSGQIQYFKDESYSHNQLELYHENISNVLAFMTQKYIDFYMVDLKKNLYIMYKFNPETIVGDVPYIGSFSDRAKNYLERNMKSTQENQLLQYASSDALKNLLKDKTYIKYFSALVGYAIKDLETAGYTDIIIKEWNSLRINTENLDCDYYHLIGGDASYFHQYHNEYMKEYSWAEETNSEILHYSSM